MLMHIYLALVAFVVLLLFVCMFRKKGNLFFQIDAALVLVTLLLRLFRVK
ncbi:MAG: hypothetical protein SPL79_10315 [Sphaerochaetaceae bacterium]|jgi:heme A synthase|nr:hypothetical protein [Spirochaetaceae bacterium]MDY6344676.1 hypothetical protein [Sphaerochaetaceae bacterium]